MWEIRGQGIQGARYIYIVLNLCEIDTSNIDSCLIWQIFLRGIS